MSENEQEPITNRVLLERLSGQINVIDEKVDALRQENARLWKWISTHDQEHKAAKSNLEALSTRVSENAFRLKTIGMKVALWASVTGALVGFVTTVVTKAFHLM